MVIDGKKIHFIVEREFDRIATDLATKFGVMPEEDLTSYTNRYFSYWNWNALFGKDSKNMWLTLEEKLNMKYIKANGPKGCHTFDFNSEMARLSFQLKFGDILV